MRRPIQNVFLLFACLGGLLPLPACGPAEDAGLALKIYYPRPATEPALRADPPPAGEAPADITNYRICVSAADMGKVQCQQFNRGEHPTRARIGGLPVGTDRRVTFQGYTQSGAEPIVQWCGQVDGVRIQNGATTQVSMYLSVCSSFTDTRTSMGTARVFHTASPLPDGRVLVLGGFNSIGGNQACDTGNCHVLTATSSAEVYDPQTGAFEALPALSLRYPRGLHTATPLPGDRLLVAGGAGRILFLVSFPLGPRPVLEVAPQDDGQAGSTAEIIDLQNLSLEGEIALAPTSPRAHHAAVGLPSGDALLLGGVVPSTNQPLASIGQFQTALGAFVDLPGAMGAARQGAVLVPFTSTASLLWGGNRAAGALPGQFAEIIRQGPDGQPLSSTPGFVSSDAGRGAPLLYGAGAALGGNQVLVAGGMIVDSSYLPHLTDRPQLESRVRMLDLQEGAERFVDLPGAQLVFPRALHSLIALPNCDLGQAMVAGGLTSYEVIPQRFAMTRRVEFFSAAQGLFSEQSNERGEVWLGTARAGHSVTPLANSTFLFSGGLSQDSGGNPILLDSAELFNPTTRVLQVR
jgi:hypothetical protein